LCNPGSSTKDWLAHQLSDVTDEGAGVWLDGHLSQGERVVFCTDGHEEERGDLMWIDMERLDYQDGSLVTRTPLAHLGDEPWSDASVETHRIEIPHPSGGDHTWEIELAIR